MRNVHAEWRIQQIHRASLKSLKRFTAASPPKLNLGSGLRPRQGWINIDLTAPQPDLRLDLREPLPFADRSIAEIYTEHFFEHLDYASVGDSTAWHLDPPNDPSEALSFLRECWRVLVPGGTLDIVVPDAECILQEYVARREQPFPKFGWWGPKWCDTAIHCVNYVFRQGREHKYAYDTETMQQVLARVGFAGIERRSFDPAKDAENHAIGSLCMTALKPAG
jgi:predicted SAM-dependent methyltransferase